MSISAEPNVLRNQQAVAAHSAPGWRRPVRPITMNQPLPIQIAVIVEQPNPPLRRLVVCAKPFRRLSQGDESVSVDPVKQPVIALSKSHRSSPPVTETVNEPNLFIRFANFLVLIPCS
jgi:hypothetical protein